MTIQNMPDAETLERSKLLADAQHGIFGSWWQLAVGMTESSCAFGFGLAQDSRVEMRRRADATFIFAEEMSIGSFRFVKKVVDRFDRMAGEMLGRTEATILVVTRALRKTGHGVTELATNTLSETIGPSVAQKNKDTRGYATA